MAARAERDAVLRADALRVRFEAPDDRARFAAAPELFFAPVPAEAPLDAAGLELAELDLAALDPAELFFAAVDLAELDFAALDLAELDFAAPLELDFAAPELDFAAPELDFAAPEPALAAPELDFAAPDARRLDPLLLRELDALELRRVVALSVSEPLLEVDPLGSAPLDDRGWRDVCRPAFR